MKQQSERWQQIVEFREALIQQFKRPVSFSEAVSLWLYKVNDEGLKKPSRKHRIQAGIQFPYFY